MMKLFVLSQAEVDAIHSASLRILNEIGMKLTFAEARELLAGAGCVVKGDRLLLPPQVVEAAIATCPQTVTLRGRTEQRKVLGDGNLYWHNLGGARDVYEPRTGTRRPATLQDVRDSTRLLDALEGVSTVVPFFTPQDVPGEVMSLAMYRHALPFTTKPLQGPGVQNCAEVRFATQMAEVIGPPEECLSLSVSPVSPLCLPDEAAEAIIEISRMGIPFAPLPCPTAGTTAPISLAGALAQQNAEVLASVILAQLARPGLPITYCGRLAMMEPRTGASVWGGVELGMASAATVQIGHKYKLPVNVYGFSTNSHVLDIQNGFERALNAIIPALAGADELSGIGEMEAGVMSAYAQMVCDNEFSASVRRVRRGFNVDDDSLAVDVIAEVMNSTHNFLGQRHTARYLRAGEVLVTKLAERGSWETWERDNRSGLAERAQAEAERLIAEHQPPPLSAEQERELDEIMHQAERELVREG